MRKTHYQWLPVTQLIVSTGEPAAHSNLTREFASLSLNLHIYIDMQIIRMSVSSVQTRQNLEKLESSWSTLAHVGFTSCWTNSRNLQRWNMEEESSFLDYMVVCKLCVDELFLLSLVRIPHIIYGITLVSLSGRNSWSGSTCSSRVGSCADCNCQWNAASKLQSYCSASKVGGLKVDSELGFN